jgi:hypothetical protein
LWSTTKANRFFTNPDRAEATDVVPVFANTRPAAGQRHGDHVGQQVGVDDPAGACQILPAAEVGHDRRQRDGHHHQLGAAEQPDVLAVLLFQALNGCRRVTGDQFDGRVRANTMWFSP